jgi:hypothetical protein
MAEEVVPPFSARNRGALAQIDNECPETTRIGLLHLLCRLVDQKYVLGWKDVAAELQRIARAIPDIYLDSDIAFELARRLLSELEWDKVFDFCERLYSHLAQETSHYDRSAEEWVLDAPRSAVQEYIATELQRLFLEENLAFEFSNRLVQRRGRRNTANQIAGADLILGDSRFSTALAHYNKALKFFRNVSQPDYENVVKEAVCAVESVAKVLFPDGGWTLRKVVTSITGSKAGQLPEPIADTFQGLYGFRNSGEGVAHGGSEGGAVTKELAEYALAVAASQIVLLADLAKSLEEDIPF